MINNRQNGRRRGRGGAPRQNGGNGQNGNRIDNRARGNAAQLHEKYKTLARDAQTQGDRVMTEYYLQFADHYFRVLSENRPRFEEQQRRDRFDGQDFEDEGDGENDTDVQAGGREDDRQRDSREERQPRAYREERQPREDRQAREERQPREFRQPRAPREDRGEIADAAPVAVAAEEDPAPEAPRRGRGRPRRVAEPAAESVERIEADRLPPSLSLSGGEDGEATAEEKPKRRTRRPRAEATGAEA